MLRTSVMTKKLTEKKILMKWGPVRPDLEGTYGHPHVRTFLDLAAIAPVLVLTLLSVGAPAAPRPLAHTVRDLESSDEAIVQSAANELRLLAQNEEQRKLIAETRAITLLINLLESSEHDGILRHAAGALWNLGVNVLNNKEIAVKGAIKPLIRLLGSAAEKVQRVAAGALRCLAWKHGLFPFSQRVSFSSFSYLSQSRIDA